MIFKSGDKVTWTHKTGKGGTGYVTKVGIYLGQGPIWTLVKFPGNKTFSKVDERELKLIVPPKPIVGNLAWDEVNVVL